MRKSAILATVAALALAGCDDALRSDALRSQNILEKATVVGSSNRNDFEVFRREGGLELTYLWNQFKVEEVELSYSDNDILNSVSLRLEKKGYEGIYGSIDANYTNITAKLSAICGSEWKKQHELEQVYESENAEYYCKYEYPSSVSYVFVTISKAAKAVPAAAEPAAAAAAPAADSAAAEPDTMPTECAAGADPDTMPAQCAAAAPWTPQTDETSANQADRAAPAPPQF